MHYGYEVQISPCWRYDILVFDTRDAYRSFLETHQHEEAKIAEKDNPSVACCLQAERIRNRIGCILIVKKEALTVFVHECVHIAQHLMARKKKSLVFQYDSGDIAPYDENEIQARLIETLVHKGIKALPRNTFRMI